ncbi:MAG: hypothetical protein IJ002_04020 [Clostridia bacterium]|nr:hypothetical protein [Clostridia bacterium]
MKLRKIVSLVLTMAMLLTMMPFAVVAEDDTTVGDLTISTVAELQSFAASVNSGNTYEGKLVVLANDIDLMDDEGNVADMSPIGTKDTPFKGTFDGQEYTISNLTISDGNADYVGLFGFISSPAVVKNVTVENPYLIGRSNVGGIVGCAYTGKVDNCHVTGEIDIKGYYKVGGITGYGYAAISGCSVIGAEDWDYNYIGAEYSAADYEGDNVGGIVGMHGEGSIAIKNCSVANVSIEGTRKVGGIVGSAFQNNIITGCSVSNVTVATNATADYATANAGSMGIGGIVGLTSSDYTGGCIEDCSVSDVTFENENDVTVSAGAITGGHRGTDAPVVPENSTIENNTVSAVTGASNKYGIPAPTGTVTPAYTKEVDGSVRVWGEGGGNASESFVLELYADNTKIATTTLNNVGGIINGDVYVTWNFFYPTSNDEYWTTTWEDGHPNSAAQPTKVVLYIDGVAAAENVAKMNAPDDLNPVVWAELGGVATPSVLEGSGTETDPFLINNINDLVWFRNDVNAGNTYEGKYVKLTGDIDLDSYTEMNVNYEGNNVSAPTFRPIGDYSCSASFKGTFDGGNNTISNLYISGWDINYCWGKYGCAGLFGTVDNATIKNLTVSGFEIQVEGGDVAAIAGHAIGDCTFENITVTDSKIATYNNGCAGIVAWSEAGDYTFKGIEIDNTVVLAGLWGSFDSSIGGVLAQADEDATYHFEDVTVACRLDCYNDVTAAYKWYSYRMCGMLIGRMTTLQTGTTEVDPRGKVTLKNVDITIGEWANYTYINTSGNTWQRVEPGYTYAGVDVESYPDAKVETLGFSTIIGGPQSQSKGYYGSDITKLEALEGFDTSTLKVNDIALEIRSRVAKVGDTYYTSLQTAINEANGATITLIVDVTENVTLTGDAIIDLGGYTLNGNILAPNANLTVKNGSIKNTDSGVSALEINAGTLTLTDVNIDSARHAVRIDGAVTATINGGTYRSAIGEGTGTYHAVNVSGAAIVTIVDGTFVGPKGTTADSGSAVNVQTGAIVAIKGGHFSGGKNSTLASKGTLAVSGGVFDQAVKAEFCAENYVPVDNGDGTYGVKATAVAAIGETTYGSLADALVAAADSKDIVIELLADATYDISSWNAYAMGGESTTTVTINGNGHTLTFNQLDSDWNNVVTSNDAKLILNNMTITNSGHNDGPWNRYDINFGCDVELNNVTSNKALAFKADATLNNVTVNESSDVYAIWIQANGQNVSIDGLTVTSAGRGIKIDEQYVTAEKVTLSVENATFTTAKKAAILVKSAEGATITTENVDIANVAADSTNAVWVDEDSAAVFSKVTVNDAYAVLENVESFVATVYANGVLGYYKTLADAAAAIATDGTDTTIKILTDIEVSESIKFAYGTGKVTFTADTPVTVKQTATSDFSFTQTDNNKNKIVVEKNVTFELYDNSSDFTVYYGPSLEVNGTITGGANWGALYLFNGTHTVSETGKIGMGRTQVRRTELTVNGEVDTNYLLVEKSTFTADGATVDANVIYDNNNSEQRDGASTFNIMNGSTVTTSALTLSYADTALTIDMSSTLTATTITGAGKIVIDAANYTAGAACPIVGNASTFTGKLEVINNDKVTASIDANGNIVLTATKAPSADLTYAGYVGTSGEVGTEKYRENIQVDLYNVYAENSLVVELWSGETKLSTTTRRATDRDDDTVTLYPVEGTTTANIVVYGRLAGSWDTEWHVAPTTANLPDTIKVYADGILVDTWDSGFINDTEVEEYKAFIGVEKAKTIYDGLVMVDVFGYKDPVIAWGSGAELYRVAMVSSMDEATYTEWATKNSFTSASQMANMLGFEVTVDGKTQTVGVPRPYTSVTLNGTYEYTKDEYSAAALFTEVIVFDSSFAGKVITVQPYIVIGDEVVYGEATTVTFTTTR